MHVFILQEQLKYTLPITCKTWHIETAPVSMAATLNRSLTVTSFLSPSLPLQDQNVWKAHHFLAVFLLDVKHQRKVLNSSQNRADNRVESGEVLLLVSGKSCSCYKWVWGHGWA